MRKQAQIPPGKLKREKRYKQMVKKPKLHNMRNAPYHPSLMLSGCQERRAWLHSTGTNHRHLVARPARLPRDVTRHP